MVFTITGKEEIMTWMEGSSATAPTHIGYGSGTTTENENDTALSTELDRKSATATRSGTEVLYEATIASTEENGNSISEVGLLNASSGGDLSSRDVFSAISKAATFDIQLDVTVRLI